MGSRAVVALLAVLAGCARPGPALLCIRHVDVFDGVRMLRGQTVLVRGDRIEALGEDLPTPWGARVIDGRGRTLLPGLLDAHTHARGEALARAAAFGVTTELDLFTDPTWAAERRKEQRSGGASGRADLFSAGILVTAPGGHGTEYGSIPTLVRAQDADAFVAARVAEGSDYIKLVYDDLSALGLSAPTLSPETLRAAIVAAHARGKLALVHIGSQAGALVAARAGADGLAHVWADEPPDPAVVAELRARGTFVIATLSAVSSVTGDHPGAALAADERLAARLTRAERAQLAGSFPRLHHHREKLAYALAAAAALNAAGVPLLAGTDAPNPGTVHGVSLHGELALLVRAGLSPLAALQSATSRTADAYRLSDRGRIAPGLRADLVLVEGDPSASIAATTHLVAVFKSGVEIDLSRTVPRGSPALVLKEPVTLGDFEQGALASALGRWGPTADQLAGGLSSAQLSVQGPGGRQTAHALRVEGELKRRFAFPWAGAGFIVEGASSAPIDASRHATLRFWARNERGAATLRVLVFAERFGSIPAQVEVPLSATWEPHEVPLQQAGTDGSDLWGLVFSAGRDGPFAFELDEVRLE